MDFLIFLVGVGIMFYFSKMQPNPKKQTSASNQISTVTITPATATPRTRPTISPPYGIEISASQQQRLGKNNLSVIAVNLAKTSETHSWLNEIKYSHFEDLFAEKKHYPALSLFFDRLFQPKK